MGRGDRDLEKRLRKMRPEPPDGLLEELLGRTGSESRERRHGRRLVPALGLTALLLIAMGAFGSVGYAHSAVANTASSAFDKIDRLVTGSSSSSTQTNHTATSLRTSHFGASHWTYPAPRVRCWITADSNRRMRVSGTTTLPAGTIFVRITQEGSGSTSGFPWTAPSIAVTSTNWGPTSWSPPGKAGREYEASVTQKAAGYRDGHTECSIKFKKDKKGSTTTTTTDQTHDAV